jgi:hypothetical protein
MRRRENRDSRGREGVIRERRGAQTRQSIVAVWRKRRIAMIRVRGSVSSNKSDEGSIRR